MFNYVWTITDIQFQMLIARVFLHKIHGFPVKIGTPVCRTDVHYIIAGSHVERSTNWIGQMLYGEKIIVSKQPRVWAEHVKITVVIFQKNPYKEKRTSQSIHFCDIVTFKNTICQHLRNLCY